AQQRGRVRTTALRERPVCLDQRVRLLLVVGRGVDLRERVHLPPVEAFDGLAAGDTARVHRVHVVAGADVRWVAEGGVVLHVGDRRAARPARVDEERTERCALAGGLLAGDGQPDVARSWLGVVQRRLQSRALETGTAGTPAELLAVVRR